MVNISYNFVDVEWLDFDESDKTRWLQKVLNRYKIADAELSYIFVTDEFLLEINKRHLKHDYYTDIITFNFNEENSLSGEMYISLDRVRENAVEFATGDSQHELCRVMVHGVLHLLGFDDKSEDDVLAIRKEEELCLELK